MDPRQLIRDGKPGEALLALQEQVRKEAADPRLRTFLFQLLCVLGQWRRALTHLEVAGELDAAALPMVQTYRAALQCEGVRADVFAGRRTPLVFGEPTPWVAMLIEALRLDAAGNVEQAAALRAGAFEQATAAGGTIDGTPFAWLADADERLGPVLEAIVNGRYFWIPLERVARVDVDAPADLRDTVWMPGTFTWTNGAQTVGLVPTRYPGTEAATDPDLLMARRTEWTDRGILGQRMLAADNADYPLMDVRCIAWDAPVPCPAPPDVARVSHE